MYPVSENTAHPTNFILMGWSYQKPCTYFNTSNVTIEYSMWCAQQIYKNFLWAVWFWADTMSICFWFSFIASGNWLGLKIPSLKFLHHFFGFFMRFYFRMCDSVGYYMHALKYKTLDVIALSFSGMKLFIYTDQAQSLPSLKNKLYMYFVYSYSWTLKRGTLNKTTTDKPFIRKQYLYPKTILH